MKAIYKKKIIVGRGIHTGPVVQLIDIPLNIHYEAKSAKDGHTCICEPYNINGNTDEGIIYVSGEPCLYDTLRLVIEEEPNAIPDAMSKP